MKQSKLPLCSGFVYFDNEYDDDLDKHVVEWKTMHTFCVFTSSIMDHELKYLYSLHVKLKEEKEEAQRALVLLEKSIKAHKSEIKPLENNVENLELVTRRQLEQIVINESQYKELNERSEMQHVKNVKEINSLKKTNGELLERLNSLRNTMETTTFSSTLFDSQVLKDKNEQLRRQLNYYQLQALIQEKGIKISEESIKEYETAINKLLAGDKN
ncbi:2732_t:CDS:2 [Entrophospora sp. SA101]|nr:946_t:CDS:2 [Entrophospora sp. SA101]CAJ0753482.1 22863_t:CDS:2 [Entrophospora sp. SA101]CAJ0761527.1 2732_t:CDS:2 [Entrophospora sp. SA101]CAJ0846848.1 12395_t:CDS:2 [Entrophospora sp. SA101]